MAIHTVNIAHRPCRMKFVHEADEINTPPSSKYNHHPVTHDKVVTVPISTIPTTPTSTKSVNAPRKWQKKKFIHEISDHYVEYQPPKPSASPTPSLTSSPTPSLTPSPTSSTTPVSSIEPPQQATAKGVSHARAPSAVPDPSTPQSSAVPKTSLTNSILQQFGQKTEPKAVGKNEQSRSEAQSSFFDVLCPGSVKIESLVYFDKNYANLDVFEKKLEAGESFLNEHHEAKAFGEIKTVREWYEEEKKRIEARGGQFRRAKKSKVLAAWREEEKAKEAYVEKERSADGILRRIENPYSKENILEFQAAMLKALNKYKPEPKPGYGVRYAVARNIPVDAVKPRSQESYEKERYGEDVCVEDEEIQEDGAYIEDDEDNEEAAEDDGEYDEEGGEGAGANDGEAGENTDAPYEQSGYNMPDGFGECPEDACPWLNRPYQPVDGETYKQKLLKYLDTCELGEYEQRQMSFMEEYYEWSNFHKGWLEKTLNGVYCPIVQRPHTPTQIFKENNYMDLEECPFAKMGV